MYCEFHIQLSTYIEFPLFTMVKKNSSSKKNKERKRLEGIAFSAGMSSRLYAILTSQHSTVLFSIYKYKSMYTSIVRAS